MKTIFLDISISYMFIPRTLQGNVNIYVHEHDHETIKFIQIQITATMGMNRKLRTKKKLWRQSKAGKHFYMKND